MNNSFTTISQGKSFSEQAKCHQCMNDEDYGRCLKMNCKGTVTNYATVDSNTQYKTSSTILHAQQYNNASNIHANIKASNNYNTAHSLSKCDGGWRDKASK
jgi:hypothetical protein